MCKTVNLIYKQKSALDLKNKDIANKMQGEGIQVGDDMVGKYFSGASGVPLDNLGAFLRSLGLKVVEADHPDVSIDEYKALKLLAGQYLKPSDQE